MVGTAHRKDFFVTEDKKGITIKAPFPLADLKVFSSLIRELRFENRFFVSERSEKFLNDLIRYAKLFKMKKFATGCNFYRARIHDVIMEKENITYNLDEMGAPPNDRASKGRLNPSGISYLYLANDINTAVSEVRPGVCSGITVAEFALNQEISLINLSKNVFTNVPMGDEYKGKEFTWSNLIADYFSTPFDSNDDTAYILTQYVAERIKKEGFDGILYDSALNKNGYNITLFNPGAAKPIKRVKVKIRSIKYENLVSEVSAADEA